MNAIDKVLDAIKGLETPEQQRWFFANNPEMSAGASKVDTPATHRAKAETFIAAQKPDVQRVLRKYGQHTDSGYRVTLPVKGNFKGGYDYHGVSKSELASLGKLGDRLSPSAVSSDGARYYLDHNPKTKEYLTPQPASLFSRIKDGVTVYKDKQSGLRFMFIVTSNSYQDRDQETITTKALQEYVDGAWSVEGKCLPRNEHLFWHADKAVGDIVWTDTEGPFLLELSKERRNEPLQITTKEHVWDTDIQSVWDAFETTKTRWGASHGFRYPEQALEKGVFKRIAKFETSTLPLDAASNPYTFSGVVDDMNKDKFLEDLLGIPGMAGKFRKGIRAAKQELDKQGLEHKAVDDVALKGHLQDAQAVLDKAFTKIGGTVPDGFSQDVLHQLINVMGDGEPDEDDSGRSDSGTSGAPAYDSSGMSGKQVKLLDRLITSQESMVEDSETTKETLGEMVSVLKTIGEAFSPLRGLPEEVKTLKESIASLETFDSRLKALETRLAGAPRRAGATPETVVDDKKLTEKAAALSEHYEELFPGGPKLRSNGK